LPDRDSVFAEPGSDLADPEPVFVDPESVFVGPESLFTDSVPPFSFFSEDPESAPSADFFA
jgi:hypothetical protein